MLLIASSKMFLLIYISGFCLELLELQLKAEIPTETFALGASRKAQGEDKRQGGGSGCGDGALARGFFSQEALTLQEISL